MSTDISWTLAQAKRDFDMGLLTDWRLHQHAMSDGWVVQLVGPKMAVGPLVEVRAKTIRVFKTLDAAVGILRDIGFQVQGMRPEKF